MKHRQKAAWFLSGVLTAALAVSVLTPALAALTDKTIRVSTGISLYIDDQKLDPKDANGNPVEPFVLNGTTYLPVRAVSEALGVPVQWEGSTWSVYVGKHASDKPAVWLKDLDYFSGTANNGFYISATEKDNAGNSHTNCITRSFDRTYLLNGQYTSLDGVIYQKYECRSYQLNSHGPSLEIYGDGNLLYAAEFDQWSTGIPPQNFHVNLTGVLQLHVVFKSTTNQNSSLGILSLGDVGLYT